MNYFRGTLLAATALLPACDGDRKSTPPHAQESPIENPIPISIPLQPPGERAFDERLAAIHRDWMGTPWTFHGTSQTPREGSIACGYFVTTTLEQAGIELDRVRLAQAASETMILAIADPKSIRRYSDVSLESFLTRVRSQGEGYYVVGLDNHTGFLKVEPDGEIAFIHSGPGRGVVSESPGKAPELANSRYRVTGKIVERASAEDEPIEHSVVTDSP